MYVYVYIHVFIILLLNMNICYLFTLEVKAVWMNIKLFTSVLGK